MSDCLIDILKEAEAKGFSKRERHEVSWRYHVAGKEYERLVVRPRSNGYNDRELDLYHEGLSQHCAIKARAYISSHIDGIQKGDSHGS